MKATRPPLFCGKPFLRSTHSACWKRFRRSTHSASPAPLFTTSARTEVFLHPLRDVRTCVAALQACASTGDVFVGAKIHSWVVVCGLHSSPFVLTSLISLYSKCGHLTDALAVFRHIESPSLFQWNAVLSGLVSHGLLEETLMLYSEMERSGVVPDKFTYPCLVKASSDLAEGPLVARSIHGRLFRVGLESDVFISSSLINAYMKMGLAVVAKKLFSKLSDRDVVLWNSMVNGFAQIGEFKDALGLFQQMGKGGVVPSKFTVTGIASIFAATGDLDGGRMIHGFTQKCGYGYDIAVSNSLIDMYGKCQSVEAANQIFEAMSSRDILSWNSIISISDQSGDHRGTLKLFDIMKDSGIPPDPVTISAVLPACAHMAALFHGRMIHGFMVVNGFGKNSDVFLDNAVMDMYAKCGSLDAAKVVFDKMPDHDTASWNIMIGAYALRGDGVMVMATFSLMREASVAPDEVTFVNVLSGCSHAGLVNQGREILNKMESEYNVVPTVEHYACVVDMLGRAGHLTEAYDLAVNVPIGFSSVVWRAYLAACQVHGDMDRSVHAAQRLLKMEPEYCGSYILLSNAYGSAGRHGDVLDVRKAMKHQNVRKAPGCSWIELGLGMQVFTTGDRRHTESDKIYDLLHVLIGQLQDFGYIPCIHQRR